MNGKIIALCACAVLPAFSHADGLAVSGKLGTLGLGIEATKAFSDSITGRIGLNGYNYHKSAVESGIEYDFKLKWQTLSALADWYPWQGSFRASAGLMYNNNKLGLAAKPSAGGYTINNVSYTAAQIGSLDGAIKFNNAAPYLGIGWGNPVAQEKGWGVVADIGALYQNSPKATLNVTPGIGAPATLQADVEAERRQLESALSSFRWYPVVSIGFSRQF